MERVQRLGVLAIALVALAGCGGGESMPRRVADDGAAAARCPAKALPGPLIPSAASKAANKPSRAA